MRGLAVVLIFSAGFMAASCGGGNGNGDCTPKDWQICEESDGKVYWMDSCGNPGSVVETCDCGCNAEYTGCKPCGGCVYHDDCDSRSICIDGDCVAAYGRDYDLSIDSVRVSDHDPDGDDWDWPGGMPDPFVCAFRNVQDPDLQDVAEFCTAAAPDTFSASWDGSTRVTIYEGDKWDFMVWDEDVSDHDYIGWAQAEPITVAAIKAGSMTAEGDYLLELVVGIEPVE